MARGFPRRERRGRARARSAETLACLGAETGRRERGAKVSSGSETVKLRFRFSLFRNAASRVLNGRGELYDAVATRPELCAVPSLSGGAEPSGAFILVVLLFFVCF